MTDVVVDRAWTAEEMQGVFDALPDDELQALHLLMTVCAAYAEHLGATRDSMLQALGDAIDSHQRGGAEGSLQ